MRHGLGCSDKAADSFEAFGSVVVEGQMATISSIEARVCCQLDDELWEELEMDKRIC